MYIYNYKKCDRKNSFKNLSIFTVLFSANESKNAAFIRKVAVLIPFVLPFRISAPILPIKKVRATVN